MSRLTAADRRALPRKDFAGQANSYPIEDQSHARDALSRVAANGSLVAQATVRFKVKAKFPGIAVVGCLIAPNTSPDSPRS